MCSLRLFDFINYFFWKRCKKRVTERPETRRSPGLIDLQLKTRSEKIFRLFFSPFPSISSMEVKSSRVEVGTSNNMGAAISCNPKRTDVHGIRRYCSKVRLLAFLVGQIKGSARNLLAKGIQKATCWEEAKYFFLTGKGGDNAWEVFDSGFITICRPYEVRPLD